MMNKVSVWHKIKRVRQGPCETGSCKQNVSIMWYVSREVYEVVYIFKALIITMWKINWGRAQPGEQERYLIA